MALDVLFRSSLTAHNYRMLLQGTQTSTHTVPVPDVLPPSPISRPLHGSTPLKRPTKRRRHELEAAEEEAEEDTDEESSDMPQALDTTYNPQDTVTTVTDTSQQS